MPTIESDQNNRSSIAELRQLLQDAEVNYDPIKELLNLDRQLAQLELTHGLTSAEFYRLYQAGEMGDDVAFVAWAGRYRLYLQLKQTISDSLKLVLALPISVAKGYW